ncbi:hypothetical protein AURANDRAFT_62726 [Aureococcus anophagefferens]|uniref:Uncharacterized protein n=1 Tax=Aureococcus anophagefferens TaxID=44056 RepID=F0Y2T9_AURAN|nr:hypothetical protein AURANDRAFT_62726 [Aureococcus anophagefferens]EGB10365.1 hypothetical protein AURANDRAFT_62726 [Aureococcus anophagefferens]|eukprot:XP_009035169.1 hypothetical protein AURANDRAFT_62726 [Aureococcus anophagefferens]
MPTPVQPAVGLNALLAAAGRIEASDPKSVQSRPRSRLGKVELRLRGAEVWEPKSVRDRAPKVFFDDAYPAEEPAAPVKKTKPKTKKTPVLSSRACLVTGVRRTICSCNSEGCGSYLCMVTGAQRNKCDCGAKGCGASLCPKTGLERARCDCGDGDCGASLCPTTGLKRALCDCGDGDCGASLCPTTGRVRGDCECDDDDCGAWLCPRTKKRQGDCPCRRLECGARLCPTTGRVRCVCECDDDKCGASLCARTKLPKWHCSCRSEECGGSLCDETKVEKRLCKCGADGCGAAVACNVLAGFLRAVKRRGGKVDFPFVAVAKAEAFWGLTVAQVMEYLVATYPGSAADVRRMWTMGVLNVDHIVPRNKVLKDMGPFVDRHNNTLPAFDYVNRIVHLQLARPAINSSKGDKFPKSTSDALARRVALMPRGKLSPSKFASWIAAVRKDVREGNYEIGDPARFPADPPPARRGGRGATRAKPKPRRGGSVGAAAKRPRRASKAT